MTTEGPFSWNAYEIRPLRKARSVPVWFMSVVS